MQMSNRDLLEWIIRPTLELLECRKATAAQNILLLVANQHLKPRKVHAGIGMYHIDAVTHQRVWDKYLAFRPELASKIRGLASQHAFLANPHLELSTNLQYATAIAWILYVVHPKELNIKDLDFQHTEAIA